MPVIMGTAGHIDHGKTTLIRALTGIDCDRLEEEKRRGITIELGFAFMDLPPEGHEEASRLGIVDVPGHERFVKNMVAGAAGIDFVLLVIAADEGVMPQTREHLEICSLLGIRHGLVALTKMDMVDEELVELVQEDVSSFLAGTFLEDAEVAPVSAQSGDGIEELRAKLAAFAAALPPRPRSDLFRMPIDRVFTMKGHGTVITGTMISGQLSVGEDVTLYPKGRSSKVRGLQSHGATAQTAPAGLRTAINLQGVDVDEVHRGETAARPGSLFPHTVWDVALDCLPSSLRALRHRTQVHFHHGSREILARLYFMEQDKLPPGESAICQVRFEEPMVGVYGDRVVVRAFSPLRTVAGGVLLNPLGRKIKRFSENVGLLKELDRAGKEGDWPQLARIHALLAGSEGVSFDALRILTNMESKALDKSLQELLGKQLLFLFDREERVFVARETVDALADAAVAKVLDIHKKDPMKQGLARGALGSTWGRKLKPKLQHFIIERLLKQGELVQEGELLRHKDHKVSLAADQQTLRQRILEAYQQGGVTPPNLKDVLAPLDISTREAQPVLQLLQEQGELVKIKEEMFYAKDALETVRSQVRDYLQAHEEMGPQEFREITGLTRKYAIPILEHLDKEKLTVRVGDKRRLRKR